MRLCGIGDFGVLLAMRDDTHLGVQMMCGNVRSSHVR